MKLHSLLWFFFMTISALYPLAHSSRNVYCVILAGGDGERLWPLSRKKRPKQLLSLYGNTTFLEQAVERAQTVASSQEKVWIITSAHHEDEVRSCVGKSVGHIIVEPIARNTAAAIITACEIIHSHDPNAHVLFIPSDAFIPASEYQKFFEGVTQALSFIENHDALIIFGVQPTHPATGYGYIEYTNDLRQIAPYPIKTFHEKPEKEIAEYYIQKQTMLWNTCMLCAPVKTFLNEAEIHCPAIISGVRLALHNKDYYSLIPSESIDCAILEKSSRIYVVPLSIHWYDVGNVGVFLSLKEKNNTNEANIIHINAKNNLVNVPNKLVALIDVDDLCIVETDDTLLISKKDKVESVKELVKQLKNTGKSHYL